MREIWRFIDNYPNYEVSNLGRVRNSKLGRLLKGVDNKGYVRVSLSNEYGKKLFLVHRLVAQAFIPNPNNFPQINHKDENPSNNSVENLEWCDSKYNLNYGNRRRKAIVSTQKPISQYSVSGEFIKNWDSTTTAAQVLNADKSGICNCLKGNRKTAYGYIWKYKI